MLTPMPVNERRADRGARIAQVLHRTLGQELRTLRRESGLSQRQVAAAIGMDHAVVSRIETGVAAPATLDIYARLFAVLGGRLSVKVYPDGQPLRDEAHLRLIERLCCLLHAAIRIQREVPIGTFGDLRAWDLFLTVSAEIAAAE